MKKFCSIMLILSLLITVVLSGCAPSNPPPAPSESAQPDASQQDQLDLNFGNQFLTMVTGSTGGSYYPIGIIFSTLWNEHLGSADLNVSAQASAGGVRT